MQEIRLALLNCYPAAARRDFETHGVPQADTLFTDLFQRILPEAKLELFFPADGPDQRPTRLDQYAGVLWSGSNASLDDDDDSVRGQVDLMRALFETDLPIWGSCWGMQVAAVAGGGAVTKSPRGREWLAARRVRPELGHDLFRGKPDSFDSLVMHLDEITKLPEGARALAANDHSAVQAMELRRGRSVFWGTQYHPEYTFETMARLMESRAPALIREGFHKDEDHVRRMTSKLMEIHAGVSRFPALERSDFIDHVDLGMLGDELDLDWSVFNRPTRELEIKNWIQYQLKPALSR